MQETPEQHQQEEVVDRLELRKRMIIRYQAGLIADEVMIAFIRAENSNPK